MAPGRARVIRPSRLEEPSVVSFSKPTGARCIPNPFQHLISAEFNDPLSIRTVHPYFCKEVDRSVKNSIGQSIVLANRILKIMANLVPFNKFLDFWEESFPVELALLNQPTYASPPANLYKIDHLLIFSLIVLEKHELLRVPAG